MVESISGQKQFTRENFLSSLNLISNDSEFLNYINSIINNSESIQISLNGITSTGNNNRNNNSKKYSTNKRTADR